MAPAEPGDPEVQRWQEWLARPRGAEGPYDIAPGHSHAETLRLIDDQLTKLIRELRSIPSKRLTAPGPEHLASCRGRIFGKWFLDAGRFRKDWEPASYSVPVYDPESGAVGRLPAKGIPGDEIPAQLTEAFQPLHAAAEAQRQLSATEVARISVNLMADIYRIHPFVDGNTRVSWVLLDTMLHKFGHPEVTTFPGDWELARARSYAIRPDAQRSPELLTVLLAKRIAGRDDE